MRTLNFSTVLILVTMLLVPIYKGGNVPFVISILLLAMVVLTFSQLLIFDLNSSKPWFYIWFVVLLSIFTHFFFLSKINGLEVYVGDAFLFGEPGMNLKGLSIAAYFFIMLVAAWSVSILTLKQISLLLLALIAMGLFQSIYGLGHFLSGGGRVLGMWEKVHSVLDVTGTFVNRNHFAGMLSLCWPVSVGALLINPSPFFPQLPHRIRVVFAMFLSFAFAIALVTSHSRMGVLAGAFGIVIWAIFFSRTYFNSVTAVSKWLPFLIALFSLIIATWFGVDDIVERFTKLDGDNSRTEIWRAMFDFPYKLWILGIGPGNFEDVFHLVQPQHLTVRFIEAHNDYLEVLLEFGLLLCAVIGVVIFACVKRLPRSENKAFRACLYGSLSATFLHSMVDFNLQIPAYAFYFAIIVGMLLNPNIVDMEDSAAQYTYSKSRQVGTKLTSRVFTANRKVKSKLAKNKASKSKPGTRGWLSSFVNSLIHPD